MPEVASALAVTRRKGEDPACQDYIFLQKGKKKKRKPRMARREMGAPPNAEKRLETSSL